MEPEPLLSRGMERHIQTVLVAVVGAMILWVGVTVTGNREEIARLQEKIDHLTRVTTAKLDDHELRIRAIERTSLSRRRSGNGWIPLPTASGSASVDEEPR